MDVSEAFEKIKLHGKRISPRRFLGHNCSLCDAYVGYRYMDSELCFDSGCHCVYNENSCRPISDDDLLRFINANHVHLETFVKEMESMP